MITAEVGTPQAPALVADSLTATSLALEWENPAAFVRLSRRRSNPLEGYLVQFRFEENVGDWKFCNNQSIGHNSTIVVENLNPYTKYRVRENTTSKWFCRKLTLNYLPFPIYLVPRGVAIVPAKGRVLDLGWECGD